MTIPYIDRQVATRPPTSARTMATDIWIPIGALLFISALAGAAAVVPRLRVLHFFQALIYVAVVVFARRGHSAAFGAGIVIAAAWNALNLFITHNFQSGARLLWSYIQSGSASRIDTMMVFVGGVAHFVLIAACTTAFLALRPDGRAWRGFALGGFGVLLYMAAIGFAFGPR